MPSGPWAISLDDQPRRLSEEPPGEGEPAPVEILTACRHAKPAKWVHHDGPYEHLMPLVPRSLDLGGLARVQEEFSIHQ